jgi:urease accessory protein
VKPDSSAVPVSLPEDLAHLQLLHLADSALPIGSLAHSFGLESLVSAEILQVDDLPNFLQGYLQEAGMLEAAALREAFQLAAGNSPVFLPARWIAINDLLSALKPARESRAASATLGRNFLRAVLGVAGKPCLRQAWESSAAAESLIHQSAAFGLVSAALEFDEGRSVLAFLHQMAANLVSACQRLLPLGQSQAMHILWNLKLALAEVAARSAGCSLEMASCTMPLLDWGAMEHTALSTRLFVS